MQKVVVARSVVEVDFSDFVSYTDERCRLVTEYAINVIQIPEKLRNNLYGVLIVL